MASLVAPGYACVTMLTKPWEVPYPWGTVVSRAPKTWILGQDWRSWSSTGLELTRPAKSGTATVETFILGKDFGEDRNAR